MRIENSQKFEATMKAYARKSAREKIAADKLWENTKAAWHKAGSTWMPMEFCPFEALDKRYDLDGCVLVSDGKITSLANIKKRFGTPLFWKKAPELVMRDGMMCWIGGEEDKRPDLPPWWWKWELTDEFGSMTYAGGEETGKEAIDFLPTHWTFLPEPPK